MNEEITVTLILQIPKEQVPEFSLDEFIDKLPVAASVLEAHTTTPEEALQLQSLIYAEEDQLLRNIHERYEQGCAIERQREVGE